METSTTKQLQMAVLDIFKEFVDICEKLNLRYYLLGGTLLGAVRHKGFIPWDDDIDVGMLREDYEVFVTKAQEFLPKHLFLQTFKTDPEYHHVFAKIRNSNTTFIESPISHRRINHGIYLDIFPLDIYDDKKISLSNRLKKIFISMRESYVFMPDRLSTKLRLVRPVSKLVFPKLSDALSAREKIYKGFTTGEKVANHSGMWGEKEIVPAWWYGDGCALEFEGIRVVGPAEYKKWLTQVYGDYMQLPPMKKRVSHHHVDVIDISKSYTEYM